jgi:ABC-type lipoprotein export system ATPase subunit/flagellar motility protein MotE (MotC chaperone)
VHIERVRVEAGFLDGLDLRLVPGLNVVIGARGTGKTSLIELIRFCLNVKGHTAESNQQSLDHALSILDSGEVTVDIDDGGTQTVTITRAARDPEPQPLSLLPPIMFSQTEIENVGLRPSGRLRLIDAFIDERRQLEKTEATAAAEVRSLTAEGQALLEGIENLEEQLKAVPNLERQIMALLPAEQGLSKISADAAEKKSQLDVLTRLRSEVAVATTFVDRYRGTVRKWKGVIEEAIAAAPSPEPWTDKTIPDPLASVWQHQRKAVSYLNAAAKELEQLETAVAGLTREAAVRRQELDEVSRELRKKIEELQAGAGAIVRQGQLLREQKAQLESLRALLEQRRVHLKTLLERRDVALDKLDEARGERFAKRTEIASRLSVNLGPRIQVEVERSGQFESYARKIAEVLRGSGLRYTDLSQVLAESVSPRELLEAVESHDFEAIADVAGISRDRAARVLSHIREGNVGEIATTLVEDNVYLRLLDGNDYKDFSELSTGQRCTVVLPIILEHKDRILIVDQPEDHIDNSFIVETLIKALLHRSSDAQIIFSTHNANIPVLGNADLVVHMGSDGRRGFVSAAAPLETPQVVESILSVMEGGVEAFKQRAGFYGNQLP